MRVLIGGVLGAAVGAAVWLGLEHFLQKDLGWLSCAVGVITGVCVHKAAGPHSGGSFLRGTLSVILTLVAIVGGRQVYVKVVEATLGDASAKPLQVASASDTKPTSGDEEASDSKEVATPETPLEVETQMPGLALSNKSQKEIKHALSEWDMLWMCLAALTAYVLGKGRDEVAPAEVPEDSQPEPPVDAPTEAPVDAESE